MDSLSDIGGNNPSPWPEDARYDRLIGDWSIYQRVGGHRTSTDDLLVAWMASVRSVQRPRRYLDLGCGIGSVMLMVMHRLSPELAQGVEAQLQSAQMARRSITELPPHDINVSVVTQDFRDFDGERAFDLVTGSPPYFPIGTGVLPDDEQRRACRFEVRGGVEAYCEAIARSMTDDGQGYLVFQTRWDDRVCEAIKRSGLTLSARVDVLMRSDNSDPFLSVYEVERSQGANMPLGQQRFAVRDSHGKWTPEYIQVRRQLGIDS